jgi:hypothetical protein
VRTILTLDGDVAFMLEQLRTTRGQSMEELVNEALRHGLEQMRAPAGQRDERFRTDVVDLGRPRLASVDNVTDALAFAGGEPVG